MSTRTNKPVNWNDFERFAKLMGDHDFQFAKTMPQIPHWYTLSRKWSSRADFEWAVQYIRDFGYVHRFGNTDYIKLNVNGMMYWTMGAPVHETILINRCHINAPSAYDKIAPTYDELFTSPEEHAEEVTIISRLGDLTRSHVLDIGCGTGMMLNHVDPATYIGIDPCMGMIERFKQNHPNRVAVCTSLKEFAPCDAQLVPDRFRYDVIVALFGVVNYMTDAEVARIPELLTAGGKYLIMFFGPGYTPVTYTKTGIHLPHRTFDFDNMPLEGKLTEIGNYMVLENG